MKKLIVEVNDDEDIQLVLQRVKHQIQDGYTSGYEPRWFLEEDK